MGIEPTSEVWEQNVGHPGVKPDLDRPKFADRNQCGQYQRGRNIIFGGRLRSKSLVSVLVSVGSAIRRARVRDAARQKILEYPVNTVDLQGFAFQCMMVRDSIGRIMSPIHSIFSEQLLCPFLCPLSFKYGGKR